MILIMPSVGNFIPGVRFAFFLWKDGLRARVTPLGVCCKYVFERSGGGDCFGGGKAREGHLVAVRGP